MLKYSNINSQPFVRRPSDLSDCRHLVGGQVLIFYSDDWYCRLNAFVVLRLKDNTLWDDVDDDTATMVIRINFSKLLYLYNYNKSFLPLPPKRWVN